MYLKNWVLSTTLEKKEGWPRGRDLKRQRCVIRPSSLFPPFAIADIKRRCHSLKNEEMAKPVVEKTSFLNKLAFQTYGTGKRLSAQLKERTGYLYEAVPRLRDCCCFGLRQPSGSRRCTRAGIFVRSLRAACHFNIITLKFRFYTIASMIPALGPAS